MKRTDALARPAMPAATTPAARPVRETRRFTIDIPVDDHRWLRRWSGDAEMPASLLVLGLLETAAANPTVRVRAEEKASEHLSARRSVGQ